MSTQWRTHQERDRSGAIKAGEFRTCQDAECPEVHFISSFRGSRPADGKWEGVKH